MRLDPRRLAALVDAAHRTRAGPPQVLREGFEVLVARALDARIPSAATADGESRVLLVELRSTEEISDVVGRVGQILLHVILHGRIVKGDNEILPNLGRPDEVPVEFLER